MKLNVTNPEAKEMHQTFGISEERATELGEIGVEEISKAQNSEGLDISKAIAGMADACNTIEELVICSIATGLYLGAMSHMSENNIESLLNSVMS